MAMSAPSLSHKQRRTALRKERRRRKRQALAQARKCDLNGAEEEEEVNGGDSEDNDAAEEERLQQHAAWLERERLAQEEFLLRTEKEEAARKKKEEEERMIKEEWESQQKRELEEKEQKQQEKRDREFKEKNPHNTFSSYSKTEAVQKMLDEAENQLDNKGPWMNPEAPVAVNSDNFGTERDVANCPFFLKTGTCRFGDRCSRKHIYPTDSQTLLIRGMFTTFGMEELRRDDYDIDACLEHSEEDLQESFLEFYQDVLPEFRSVGKVVQFKVCCNYEPHLRGNVYVQFATEEQCREAFMKFNGRWYAGRQLQCEMCAVTRWKGAICGLFDRRKCPKGKHCNFLHVFRNPGNEFWEADRDLQLSPDRSARGSRRDEWHSERYSERSWRQRRYSTSPVRSERSHSRREADRQRRTSHQYREDRRWSRSRHRDRRTERLRSRSRDRSRSRSRDGEQRRRRNQSREKKHSSEERERIEDEGTDREARQKSRSTSREKKKKRSREKSPKKATDGTKSHHRHKHSKKSKKTKKKHKKKSLTPDVTTSPEESGNENESEKETEDNPAQSPGGDINRTEKTQEKHVDEKDVSSEVKSNEGNTEITSTPTGNGDTDS